VAHLVGSATLNTSQQVGGSIGTALLNTLAAGAASAYLVGRAITPANLQAAAIHSYTTAFLYSSAIFVVAAVIAVSNGGAYVDPTYVTPGN
jgi:hypothetical protein